MDIARFIGREREVAQLDLAIGPGRDGLRLALLNGPSGLGKTTLSVNAARRASTRGFRVATVRGRAGSLSTPFAPFIEAMPEFEALLSVLASDQSVEIEHAGIGLVNLLAELSSHEPLLLIFDDVQALDESSIALLPFISGLSERADVSLLFVEQSDAIGIPDSYRSFIDGLLARRVVGHLPLGPMDDGSIRLVVAAELGVEDPADVSSEVVIRAGGNPWFAKELARSWASGMTEIPTNIAAAATARLYALDERGQELVTTVAMCPEGAHVGWLEEIAQQRPRAFAATMDLLLKSGLIREDGDILTIAHPLMQQALADELGAALRRAIHLELVEAIARVPIAEAVSARALGYHASHGGRADEAVAHYLRASEAHELLGRLHEAYADLMFALDAEPRVGSRVELLRRCATMAMQLGMSVAIDHWTELGRLAAAQGDNELYAYALLQQYWASNDGTANERLNRAASLGSDECGWAARAAATVARMDGRQADAIRHDERAIEIARERGDGLLETMALGKLAASLTEAGQNERSIEVARLAIDRAIRERLHDWAATSWGGLVEALMDDLDSAGALHEAEAVDKYVIDLGIESMRPAVLAWKTSALIRAGELERAHESIEEAIALDLGFRADPRYRQDHLSALVYLLRAEVANEIALPDAYDRAVMASAVIDELGFASWSLEGMRERARAIARRDGIAAALPMLADLEDAGEPNFVGEMTLWLLRTSVAQDFNAGVDRVRALREAVSEWDASKRLEAVRDEIDTVLRVLDGAPVTELDAMSTRWADAGRALDALRVASITGTIALRRGEREIAEVYLQSAKTGLATCGASAEADQVAALLRQLGKRSRAKSRTTSVGPLTKRELEIARLVSSGLKNSEVAATLFLAEKTVAAHLSNIYGKVEVRSRVQLGQWIRENDPEFEATLVSAAAG